MVNRTAIPIEIGDIGEYNALALQTRNLTPAYFGDGAGNFQVTANGFSTDHYGKCWIRFAAGVDSNGATTFTQPVAAQLRTNVPLRTNYPVLVYRNPANDQWVIASIDYESANAAGDNTNALNLLDPVQWQTKLEDVRNFKMFAVGTDTSPSTDVTIEPLIYQYDGSLYNAGKTTADNLDLSSYIPTNGTERLVAIGERAYDGSIQIISGSARAISTTNYGLSDVQILSYQFEDMVMINRAVRLANDAGRVREKDLYLDLRQFVNVPQPRGFPQVINRHIQIVENYQQPFHTLTIGVGVLQIDGLLYEAA